MPDISQESLDGLERDLRRSLGPDQRLVDIFIAGQRVGELISSAGGRAIIEDCAKRVIEAMAGMSAEDATPEQERIAMVAFKLNIAILRRMAAIVRAGEAAGDAIEQTTTAPDERRQ